MDKKTVLLASACTLLMISCSNDSELINVAETTGLQTKAFVGEADFQIVDYAGDKCIQFKNDSVFNAMLWEMNDMSEEERNNIFSGAGFVSQWQLMQEADQEQELIVDNYEKDLSQPWPAHQIKEFKQKYDDVFMFEPYDSTDFIAHYKLNHCVVIIDDNKKQLDGTTKEVMNPFSIENKMKAFGFYTQTVKGNDEEAIDEAINRAKNVKDQAVCIILDSIKGAGVPYFEQLDANHSVKFNNDTIKKATKDAIKELDEFIKGGAR